MLCIFDDVGVILYYVCFRPISTRRPVVCICTWITDADVAVSCKKTLEPGKCSEHEQHLFCQQCYCKQFGPLAVKTTSPAAAEALPVSDTSRRTGNGAAAYIDTLWVFCDRRIAITWNMLQLAIVGQGRHGSEYRLADLARRGSSYDSPML